ncbi:MULTISPECIES: 3-oxoacyl-ACP reductase FabG [Acidithrix]|uniref:3-oxoacyl-[acyl-carrier-protein] reductase FabG n=1 Tax=Acidithrix ferrooxidans TaxID=1280514 RepID=A0A0D8HJ10_9ACTN|nr:MULTISPECIES: 3-oxoacyl-ACP reductase FabG [Acidithrix]KJF17076.1 3-oxoacyl-[acyl-carrier-protein] reductase FabG [Acidithrix ferrooxidans]
MQESRCVFITGGATGIGAATSEVLLERGYKVAVTYRSRHSSENLTKYGDRFMEVSCDVSDSDSIDSAIDQVEAKFGKIEILIVNAGITEDTLLLRMSHDAWDSVIETNLTGAFRLTKKVLPSMVRARFGRIVFVSSVIAGMGGPGQANYAASKAGLSGFARSLAREVASRNITANVIAPGAVATAMTANLSQKRMDEMTSSIPMQRVAEPSDISGAIAFLVSEEAAYITGVILPVDGGLSMGF